MARAEAFPWALLWRDMMMEPADWQIHMTDLDRLMPMHLILSQTGHVRHVAPTLAKLHPAIDLLGRRFLELVELRRPRNITSMSDLFAALQTTLHLRFRDVPGTTYKGLAVPLNAKNDLLVNLSFGIAVAEAVRTHSLTIADFAPTDLTVEMLYLIEAQSAVMRESQNLNQRLQGARKAAEEQALTDTLTGLKNRRAMDLVLSRLIITGARFAVMHLDLDHFKTVNDTLGHAAGDHVLQVVAQALVAETRANDTIARVGGDEFVLIFDRLVDHETLRGIATRIIQRLERPMRYDGQTCRISASAGITTSTLYDLPTADGLLADADEALYASKHRGRACVTVIADLPGRVNPAASCRSA